MGDAKGSYNSDLCVFRGPPRRVLMRSCAEDGVECIGVVRLPCFRVLGISVLRGASRLLIAPPCCWWGWVHWRDARYRDDKANGLWSSSVESRDGEIDARWSGFFFFLFRVELRKWTVNDFFSVSQVQFIRAKGYDPFFYLNRVRVARRMTNNSTPQK